MGGFSEGSSWENLEMVNVKECFLAQKLCWESELLVSIIMLNHFRILPHITSKVK